MDEEEERGKERRPPRVTLWEEEEEEEEEEDRLFVSRRSLTTITDICRHMLTYAGVPAGSAPGDGGGSRRAAEGGREGREQVCVCVFKALHW